MQDVGVARVDLPSREEVLVARRRDAEAIAHRLQLAVAALLAEHAEVVALDEEHLHEHLSVLVQSLASRSRRPPLLHRLGAGARRATVDAHRADTAAAERLDAGLVAEARDVDAGGICGFDDRLAGLGLDRLAVDLEADGLVAHLFSSSSQRGRIDDR
jgi:hypothetical protein